MHELCGKEFSNGEVTSWCELDPGHDSDCGFYEGPPRWGIGALLMSADSEISHMLHRGSWATSEHEVQQLVARIRETLAG